MWLEQYPASFALFLLSALTFMACVAWADHKLTQEHEAEAKKWSAN